MVVGGPLRLLPRHALRAFLARPCPAPVRYATLPAAAPPPARRPGPGGLAQRNAGQREALLAAQLQTIREAPSDLPTSLADMVWRWPRRAAVGAPKPTINLLGQLCHSVERQAAELSDA
eukprot:EG_transcript_53982